MGESLPCVQLFQVNYRLKTLGQEHLQDSLFLTNHRLNTSFSIRYSENVKVKQRVVHRQSLNTGRKTMKEVCHNCTVQKG